MTTPQRTGRHVLPIALTMCPPAVRMVLIQSFAVPDKSPPAEWQTGEEICPVLALVGQIDRVYERLLKPHERYPDAPAPTHEGLTEAGWWYDDTPREFDVLIYADEIGFCTSAELRRWRVDTMAFSIVVCPWPEAEDSERLKSTIEDLRRTTIERTVRDRHPRSEKRC